MTQLILEKSVIPHVHWLLSCECFFEIIKSL